MAELKRHFHSLVCIILIALGILPGTSANATPYSPSGGFDSCDRTRPYWECVPMRAVGRGSGFAIDERGTVVTNAHVVEGCTEVRFMQTDGNLYKATIIAVDEKNDLVALNTGFSTPDYARLRAETTDLVHGQDVAVVGYTSSDGNRISYNQTTVINRVHHPSLIFMGRNKIYKGNSGSAVIDAYGHVVGVVERIGTIDVKTDSKIPIAIASNTATLRRFLDVHSIGYTLAKSVPPSYPSNELFTLAEQFTLRIYCYRSPLDTQPEHIR